VKPKAKTKPGAKPSEKAAPQPATPPGHQHMPGMQMPGDTTPRPKP
jgi:hypothetical protein